MRQHVAVEMVHIYQRRSQPQRQTFGEACAYKERADKARTAGEGYGRELLAVDACAAQGGVDHGHYVLLMGARGKLGHHAAVFFVHALAGYDIAQ